MKPILKWAGGKSWLLPEIKKLIGNICFYNNYYEPFVGGGAILFGLAPNKAVINDLNTALINMYLNIKYNCSAVISSLKDLAGVYINAVKSNTQIDFYYLIRKTYNLNLASTDPKISARFIFLNKTCFNGLYRVNADNQFNVGPNRLSDKQFKTLNNLLPLITEVSDYLQTVEILNKDYKNILDTVTKDDLVYFDPPYDYQNMKGFVSYQKDGFSHENLTELRDIAGQLVKRGAKVIISNNDTEFVRTVFSDSIWKMKSLSANRSINSDSSKRSGAKEVLISNINTIDLMK